MGLVQDEDMSPALAADGADHPLREGVLPGCARGGEDLADPHALDVLHELLAVDTEAHGVPRAGHRGARRSAAGRAWVLEGERLWSFEAEGHRSASPTGCRDRPWPADCLPRDTLSFAKTSSA